MSNYRKIITQIHPYDGIYSNINMKNMQKYTSGL